MPVIPDKRKHIFLSDKNLIEKLDRIKHLENITFDEVFEKYLTLPESDDIIHKEYIKVEKLMVLAYGKKDQVFNDQRLRILMEYFWSMAILAAKGNYDIDKLLLDIDADFTHEIYKKKR
jgi:hypothetical protein